MIKIYPRKKNKKIFLINERIPGEELRVLDEKGKQLGIISKNKALDIAREKNCDLVLIAPNAKPPVVKVIDFNKFLYQENKKLQESKRGSKKGGNKDIQLSLFIGEADKKRLIKKAQEFLNEGYQIRLKMLLRGRELSKKEIALSVMNEFINSIQKVTVAKPPYLQGKMIFAVIVPQKQ